MQAYSDPTREGDPHALPDIEVFYVREDCGKVCSKTHVGADPEPPPGWYSYGPVDCKVLTEPGWYWWACFPGCLPDSDPIGPFATEEEALADAQGNE